MKFSETYTGYINNVPVLIKILPYNKSNQNYIIVQTIIMKQIHNIFKK